MKLRNKKTGEIVQNFDGFTTFTNDWSSAKNLQYTSLTKLNEDWEDYTSTEPLIKDEKIRKAVRAWAEAVGTNSAFVEKGSYFTNQLVLTDITAEIHFRIDTPEEIKPCKRYTIAELCGEEE